MSNYNELNNPNYNSNINSNPDNNFLSAMTNENFINMASSIDLDNLNGTSIMDLGRDSNMGNQNNPPMQNTNSFNNGGSFNVGNFNPNIPLNNMIPMNNMQTFNNINPMGINNPQLNMQNNPNPNSNINGMGQDKHLIKSITRELINNLKENNISLHDDNTTHNSSYIKNNKIKIGKKTNDFDSLNDNGDNMGDADYSDTNTNNYDYDYNGNGINQSGDIGKSKKSKKMHEYKDNLKKGLENMMTESGVPASSTLTSYIFDDLFNLKEFIILFGVYFLLSQEMVKDLFAQYFTSLNPDDNGRVHVKGVIIYGLILTVLYMILKKVI
jgi:hypothetical protein